MTSPLAGSADYTSAHDRRTADRLAPLLAGPQAARSVADTAFAAGYADEDAVAASRPR